MATTGWVVVWPRSSETFPTHTAMRPRTVANLVRVATLEKVFQIILFFSCLRSHVARVRSVPPSENARGVCPWFFSDKEGVYPNEVYGGLRPYFSARQLRKLMGCRPHTSFWE